MQGITTITINKQAGRETKARVYELKLSVKEHTESALSYFYSRGINPVGHCPSLEFETNELIRQVGEHIDMLMAVLNAANTSASSSAPRNLIQTWKRAVDSHALANDVKNHVFKDSTNPSSPEPERITGGVETKDGKVKKVWLTSSGPDTLYLPQEKVDEINSQ